MLRVQSRTLNELAREACRIATEHGFKDASIGEDLALMHSELSEALEDHRAGRKPTEVWYEEPYGDPIRIEHEDGTVEMHQPMRRCKKKYAVTDAECGLCQGRGSFMATVADRDPSNPCPNCDGTGKKLRLRKPCGIPSELADVAVRVLHFVGKHEIDLDTAVSEKMAFNDARPFKHGGKAL